MKHAALIKKLEEATTWRDVAPGLLLTVREVKALLKLLRSDQQHGALGEGGEVLSITKRSRGIGGDKAIRRLAKVGDQIINKADLDPSSRNGRRIMKKLRVKYGDDVIDREIERLQQKEQR